MLSLVADAARSSGRQPEDVTIVAVTKTVDRDVIDAAYALGLRHFGENRVQDARRKLADLRPLPAEAVLHLIGQLQSNKAKPAVALFDIIESVDRMSLIDALEKEAERRGEPVSVLLQVNIAREPQKAGCMPESASELMERLVRSPWLRPRGLMTMAPLVADAEETRPVFSGLRALRDASATRAARSRSRHALDGHERRLSRGHRGGRHLGSHRARDLCRGEKNGPTPRHLDCTTSRRPVMARPFLFGTNFKMNQTPAESAAFYRQLAASVQIPPDTHLFVIPPFTSLAAVSEVAAPPPHQIWVGAQNVHWAPDGAYTGEISVGMLLALDVDLVLLGHAERRRYFHETDVELNRKVLAALGAGLRVLLAVGETAEERSFGVSGETVLRQLRIGLHGVPPEHLGLIQIAYEPVWSIGAGGTPASPEDVEPIAKADQVRMRRAVR